MYAIIISMLVPKLFLCVALCGTLVNHSAIRRHIVSCPRPLRSLIIYYQEAASVLITLAVVLASMPVYFSLASLGNILGKSFDCSC